MKCKDCVHYKLCRDVFCQVDTLTDDDKKCDYYEPTRPHGEWIKKYNADDPTTACSVCGFDTEDKVYFNFCPCCGADMREGDAE